MPGASVPSFCRPRKSTASVPVPVITPLGAMYVPLVATSALFFISTRPLPPPTAPTVSTSSARTMPPSTVSEPAPLIPAWPSWMFRQRNKPPSSSETPPS